jgi:gliding-associated putative ABC transporter substrate-binding component GldG
MERRRLKTGADALAYSALVVGILVAANVLGARFFHRFDLTEQKVFTLSQASKDLVARLDDKLTIKVFLSKDLPPRVAQVGRYVRDLVDEYATNAKGHVTWEVVDPGDSPELQQEATRMKVQKARLQVMERSKISVGESYLGIGFQYQGKIEAIPLVRGVEGLEYEISSIVKRLSAGKRKIAFSEGHGEPGPQQGLAAVTGALGQYEVVTARLGDGSAIPGDVDALVVIGAQQSFGPRAQYEIDRLLMRGKAVALLLDGMTLETPRGQMPPGQVPPRIARANDHGLGPLLEHWGLALRPDVVLDAQNARVPLQVGPGQAILANYPGFPVLTDLDRTNPVSRDLKGLVPVLPSSIELLGGDAKSAGLETTVLARTTPEAWRQSEIFIFDPLHPPKPTGDRGPFTIAVARKGRFKSYFAGKPTPEPDKADGETEPAPELPVESVPPEEGVTESPASARLVLVSDSDLVRDGYLRYFPSNGTFFLNLVDWMAQDEALIGIRGKQEDNRPLAQVDDARLFWVKYGNVVGLPMAFILLGVVRWRVRVSRRAAVRL